MWPRGIAYTKTKISAQWADSHRQHDEHDCFAWQLGPFLMLKSQSRCEVLTTSTASNQSEPLTNCSVALRLEKCWPPRFKLVGEQNNVVQQAM